jgi:hypothetical protein
MDFQAAIISQEGRRKGGDPEQRRVLGHHLPFVAA